MGRFGDEAKVITVSISGMLASAKYMYGASGQSHVVLQTFVYDNDAILLIK